MEETKRNSKNSLNESPDFRSSVTGQSMQTTSAKADIPSDYKGKVHVRFLLDSNYGMRSVFQEQITVGSTHQRVAEVLDMDEQLFKIKIENKEMNDSVMLKEVSENPLIPVNAKVQFIDPGLGIEKFNENLPLLDIITVHFQEDEDSVKNITVVIEDHSLQKQWLGGYRSKQNGKEYHHALAQTTPEYTRITETPKPKRFHRDTQTAKLETRETTTKTNKGTQMWRRDHYITSNNDKIIVAKPYKTCKNYNQPTKQYLANVARVIQKVWRTLLVKKKISSAIQGVKQRLEYKKEFIESVFLEQTVKERNILIGAAYPVTRDDFFWLYLMVNLWLKVNWNILHIQRTDLSRKAKKYVLHRNEINSLCAIEKHKINNKKEVFKKKEIKILELTARPKIFRNKSGKLVSVDDIETQRAREYCEIYSELIKRDGNITGRVSFLNRLKCLFTTTGTCFTYEYANEIVSLVDREIYLLTMGLRNKDLKGLRMRLEQLFMHFTSQEEFNPKVAPKYQKSYLPGFNQYFQCNRCTKLKPPSMFPVHFRMREFSVCTSCKWLYDIGHIHVDLSPYRKLIEQVRQDEINNCCTSSVCFLIRPEGVSYLTVKIWHNHSAISQSSVITNLRHVRWLRDVDWSPWNTILLTAEEAQFHLSIPDVHEFYQPSFIKGINNKHIMARNYFKDLEKLDYSLCADGTCTSSTTYDKYLQKYYDGLLDFMTTDNVTNT